MNHEHHPHHRAPHPEAEPQPWSKPEPGSNQTNNPEAGQSRSRPIPHTRLEARILHDLQDAHGAAFAVYLDHVWHETPISAMEEDFRNVYWASYEQLDHFIDDTIDALGWTQALTEFLAAEGMTSDMLTWNRHAIFTHLADDYEFIEKDGLIHVFAR